jgi:CheY-like chemotaxis protein
VSSVVRMRTVLNVEDSADDLLMMRVACRNANVSFRYESVQSGAEVTAYMMGEGVYGDRKQFPLPDFVLLDLKMPRTNGFQVLKWIRSQAAFRELPVVVYSGSVYEGDVNHAQQLGANEFLVKSGGLEYLVDLARAIELAFAQEPPSMEPIQSFIARYPGYHTPPSEPWAHCVFPKEQFET